MKNPPSIDTLAEAIQEILTETLIPEVELLLSSPLMKELGLDSLDMIEASFALEEAFDVEFSGRNAIEELDRVVGDEIILREGFLTDLGTKILLQRMPALAEVELPGSLRAADIPQYFTIRTFAGVIKDFYDQTPDLSPNGEVAVLVGLEVISKGSGEPVPPPTGDEILESWLEEKSKEISGE